MLHIVFGEIENSINTPSVYFMESAWNIIIFFTKSY